MQWVVLFLVAAVVIVLVGFVLQLLKWLLILAAVVALVGVLMGALFRDKTPN